MARLYGLLLTCVAAINSRETAAARLDVIDLPVGFAPEGITGGFEWTAYVGSLATGDIWMGDLRTGEGEVKMVGAEGPAVGLDFDRRSSYLFVSGGPTGTGRVYDEHFELVADLPLAGEGASTFVNDVIVTRTAAYFTDSFAPQFYKVPLDRRTGMLMEGSPFETIPYSEGFPFKEGAFNANGIEATDDGSMLIVVSSEAQSLYTVDPDTGAATMIDLGGALITGSGDGLVLRKNTLWVIDNAAQVIHEVSLSEDLACGLLLPRSLSSSLFNVPTTAMRKGNSLYAVNAKFGTPDEDVPTTPYEIVRVDRDSGMLMCAADAA